MDKMQFVLIKGKGTIYIYISVVVKQIHENIWIHIMTCTLLL